jgi:hypothetical protein
MGILPHHASVMPQPDGTYVVGPVTKEAGMFLLQGGAGQAWPVQAMVKAKAGDQVIFGTPTGPRFQIQSAASGVSAAAPGTAGAAAGGSKLATGIASEVQRRTMARLLTTSPFRDIYYFYSRYKVGTFSNPYYIVGAAIAVTGAVVAAGGLSCSGIAAALWASMRY